MSVADDYQIDVLKRAIEDQKTLNSIALDAMRSIAKTRKEISVIVSDLLASYNGDRDAILSTLPQAMSDISQIRKEAILDAVAKIKKEITELSEESGEWAIVSLSLVLALSQDDIERRLFSDDSVSDLQIRGRTFDRWIDSLIASDVSRISDAVTIGIAESRKDREITAAVLGTNQNHYRDGILHISERDLEALVLTSGRSILETAKEAAWGLFSAVVGYRWVSVLDSRTSNICRLLSNNVIEIEGKGDVIPRSIPRVYPPNLRPPAHWRCRSILVPIYSYLGELLLPKEIALDDLYSTMTVAERLSAQSVLRGPARL